MMCKKVKLLTTESIKYIHTHRHHQTPRFLWSTVEDPLDAARLAATLPSTTTPKSDAMIQTKRQGQRVFSSRPNRMMRQYTNIVA
jgi:hypothetical protein